MNGPQPAHRECALNAEHDLPAEAYEIGQTRVVCNESEAIELADDLTWQQEQAAAS